MPRICYLLFGICFLFSCSIEKKISQSASKFVLKDSSLLTAHVGISVFEPETNKYWYNYQGDHFFVPASNTKIPTCYAAMKYLGDSLVGLKYAFSDDKIHLVIAPAADPSFLHPDYKKQPVWDFLANQVKNYRYVTLVWREAWQEDRWGSGWSWNDYEEAYMAERSMLPIYGNVIDVKLLDSAYRDSTKIFKTQNHFFDSLVNKNIYELYDEGIRLKREMPDNTFYPEFSTSKFTKTSIPFATLYDEFPAPFYTAERIIADSLKYIFKGAREVQHNTFMYAGPHLEIEHLKIDQWHKIYSQPTDSLLKPMMHRSDNFFAEQSLLMVSNQLLGVMNDEKIIDTLLKTDFKDLPQKPRWADGSGLSRYNLFTPQDFVTILNKMKNDFGMDRIKLIFPTGGEGTLSTYYKPEAGYIFAKTGTLSGVVAISGFLYTRKNKLLIFSVLVNNHTSGATSVRRAVEKFIQELRFKY